MNQVATLFVSTFTTLLAIINPLESLPVFLKLLEAQDRHVQRLVGRACHSLISIEELTPAPCTA